MYDSTTRCYNGYDTAVEEENDDEYDIEEEGDEKNYDDEDDEDNDDDDGEDFARGDNITHTNLNVKITIT